MSQENWSTVSQETPPVAWDADAKTFKISLGGIDAEWQPPYTYVVRIREYPGGEWSVGFESPLTGCDFQDLKPDTDYEVEVRAKNSAGLSEPNKRTFRTLPEP